MSLTARIERLLVTPAVAGFLVALSVEDAAACTQLLDERAANPGFVLDYWVPRTLVGRLSAAQTSLFAVPALTRAPLGRPAALRMAGRLGGVPADVDKLVALGLWIPARGGLGLAVHPLAAAIAADVTALRDPEGLLRALLAADTVDELAETALGGLAGLLLGVASPALLAEAAPRVIDSLQLADRLEDALPFGHAVVDRVPEAAKAEVLFALGEALLLDERDDEALSHFGMAAAFAEPGTRRFGACRLAMGELLVERADGEGAGTALAEAHSAFVADEAWDEAAEAACTLGALAVVAGHASVALRWLRDAVRLGGLAGNQHRVVAAYELIAEAERSRGFEEPGRAAQTEAERVQALLDA